jgi:iron(II)-dependent oxidoreductase
MATGAQSVHQSLLQRLAAARAMSDELFRIVRPQALYDRPIGERHRIVFYIGHLEAFDWNLLTATLFEAPSFDKELDRLFAFGIDPVDGGLPSDQAADWPRLEQVRAYNRRVRETIDRQLEGAVQGAKGAASRASPRGAYDPAEILNVAIEHRLMHAETLAYMFHWLPLEQKAGSAGAAPRSAAAPAAHRMMEIPAGTATLGLRRGNGFGWDNEFAEHVVEVPAFAMDKYKVTNAQYLEFVRAGSYGERSLWRDADWQWKEKQGLRHPKFWVQRGGAWRFRAMFAEVPLPGDWPVYVSQAEASAYARWAGKALPSEAQFHRAAYGAPDGRERAYPWGSERPSERRGNFDFHRWDPVSVAAHPEGESAFRVADLVGNGWEWTSTEFAPFEGFEAFPFYPGYSANFFDGQHYVMKGGSMRTAACMLRRSFRNWFQPHYPHIYAGFRCVAPAGSSGNPTR